MIARFAQVSHLPRNGVKDSREKSRRKGVGGRARGLAIAQVNWLATLPQFTASVMLGTTLAWGGQSAALAQTEATSPASTVQLAQNAPTTSLLFVDPIIGSDASGDGSVRSPFRSITRALQSVQSNTTILLAAGTYSNATGEHFPLMLPPTVTLQASPTASGRSIVIRGGGEFASPAYGSQNITLLAASAANVIGVEVNNPNSKGNGLWVASDTPSISGSESAGAARQPSTTPATSTVARAQTSVPATVSTSRDRPNTFPSPNGIQTQARPPASNPDGLFIMSFVRPDAVRSAAAAPRSTQPTSRSTARSAAAVTIPVPPPNAITGSSPLRPSAPPSRRALATAPTVVAAAASQAGQRSPERSIEIPVPPPASLRTAFSTIRPAAPSLPVPRQVADPSVSRPAAPARQYSLLPVPDGDPPVGNIGDMPTVAIARNWTPPSRSGASAVANYSAPSTLRYRVLVLAEQNDMQERVRSLVPGAFATSYSGRTVMQLGAFSTRDNAEAAARRFSQSGLQTVVREMD